MAGDPPAGYTGRQVEESTITKGIGMVKSRRGILRVSTVVALAAFSACSETSNNEVTGSSVVQAIVTATEASFFLNGSVSIGEAGLLATSSMRINDRAKVFGMVVNTGPGETNLGVSSLVEQDVVSEASVVLRNNAVVQGSVLTSGAVTFASGATVAGDVAEGAAMSDLARTITGNFDDQASDVFVNAGQTRELAPGAYGAVTVNSSGRLLLQPGTYYVASFSLTAGAVLEHAAGQLTAVISKGSTSLGGAVTKVGSGQSGLLMASFSPGTLQVDTPFEGALLAPNGKINLQTSGPFAGQAIGASIELHQDRQWTHVEYPYWDDVLESPNFEAAPEGNTGGISVPSDPVGDAIREFRDALATTSRPLQDEKQAVLEALPPADVAQALASAFDAAADYTQAWHVLFITSLLKLDESLPFLKTWLEQPVPPEYTSASPIGGVRRSAGKLYVRGTEAVATLALLGNSEARDFLLQLAATHQLQLVRSTAIIRIEREGDTSLRDSLRDVIQSGDEQFLNAGYQDSTPVILGPPDDEEDERDISPPQVGVPSTPTTPQSPQEPTGTGGTGPAPTCDDGGVNLGGPGNLVTIPTNGCVFISDYPDWWDTRDTKLQNPAGSGYPIPFTWTNPCSGSSGSGTYTGDWQELRLSTTSEQCPTQIQFQGNGTTTISLKYYSF